ncbi:MAG: hypothetical protein K5908_03575 [Erysipelotrichaceae bacterium]|nr:hypothetical protein [Erysipelotrichaceae bacterium]
MSEKLLDLYDSFYFRKLKTKRKIQDLLDLMTGRETGIRGLISDQDGNFSQERFEKLLKELIHSLCIYVSYRTFYTEHKKEYRVPERETEVLDAYRGNLFCSFTACALISLYEDPEATLSAIIDLSSGIQFYPFYEELLLARFQKLLEAPLTNPVHLKPEADKYVTYCKEIAYDLNRTDTIRTFISICYPQSSDKGGPLLSFRKQMGASERDIDLLLERCASHHIDVPRTWITQYEEEKDNGISEDETEMEKWLHRFLHFQQYAISPQAFTDAISGMIDVWSIEHTGSVYTDPAAFYQIYDIFAKTEKHLKKEEDR